MKERTNEMKKEKLTTCCRECWRRGVEGFGRTTCTAEVNLEGVAQRTDSHLTNSLPALSLCVTGRGESWGNRVRGVR